MTPIQNKEIQKRLRIKTKMREKSDNTKAPNQKARRKDKGTNKADAIHAKRLLKLLNNSDDSTSHKETGKKKVGRTTHMRHKTKCLILLQDRREKSGTQEGSVTMINEAG